MGAGVMGAATIGIASAAGFALRGGACNLRTCELPTGGGGVFGLGDEMSAGISRKNPTSAIAGNPTSSPATMSSTDTSSRPLFVALDDSSFAGVLRVRG